MFVPSNGITSDTLKEAICSDPGDGIKLGWMTSALYVFPGYCMYLVNTGSFPLATFSVTVTIVFGFLPSSMETSTSYFSVTASVSIFFKTPPLT
ncbi:hypothetical protein [Heyndrickxia oleronia]|uniref:hypothetical protein n=1 Tax=Heyndrickxia oleronia TaxID=38875 RepID=UPI001C0F1D05|nr:hypothetical protein [Heyndrickxia oleronia]MBU5211621.1 hypothetical protein [Heyndrickxia oleronia]